MAYVRITDTFAGGTGAPATGSLKVTLRNSSTLGNLFTDATGATAMTNPCPIINGSTAAFVAEGSYDLTPIIGGVTGDAFPFEAVFGDRIKPSAVLTLDQVPSAIADVNVNNHKLTNVANPTTAGDAMNKGTADATYAAISGGGGGGSVSSVFSRGGAVVATTGDYTAAQVTNAADTAATTNQNFAGLVFSANQVAAPTLRAMGITGTSPGRFVGASSPAPTTGTFALGDFIVDPAGDIAVCTVAGTPGTWVSAGGSGGNVMGTLTAGPHMMAWGTMNFTFGSGVAFSTNAPSITHGLTVSGSAATPTLVLCAPGPSTYTTTGVHPYCYTNSSTTTVFGCSLTGSLTVTNVNCFWMAAV